MNDSIGEVKVKLTGVAPLIMHNGQMANPLNPYAKEMKKISGKRKKTESDYEQMAKLQFLGSLYLNEKDQVVIPCDMLYACLINGAKNMKKGKLAASGIFIEDNPVLEYEGEKNPEKMFLNGFRFDVLAVINRSKVMVTRARFDEWSVTFTVKYAKQILNEGDILEFLHFAGLMNGLGTWRPRYGRFNFEVL